MMYSYCYKPEHQPQFKRDSNGRHVYGEFPYADESSPDVNVLVDAIVASTARDVLRVAYWLER